jgi:hypothetical protein
MSSINHLVHGIKAGGVALGYEAAMAQAMLAVEGVAFGVGQQGGEERRGLRGAGVGGRAGPGRVRVERRVVCFALPPSWVTRPHPGRSQARVAADPLEHALAWVRVAQGPGAAAFQGQEEVGAELAHNGQVLGRGVSALGPQVVVGDLLRGLAQQLWPVRVWGARCGWVVGLLTARTGTFLPMSSAAIGPANSPHG